MRPVGWRLAGGLLAGGLLAGGCDDGPQSCPSTRRVEPAAGTGVAAGPGGLVAGAEKQTLTISPDRTRAEYRFELDGVVYTARYVLAPNAPPPALRFVSGDAEITWKLSGRNILQPGDEITVIFLDAGDTPVELTADHHRDTPSQPLGPLPPTGALRLP